MHHTHDARETTIRGNARNIPIMGPALVTCIIQCVETDQCLRHDSCDLPYVNSSVRNAVTDDEGSQHRCRRPNKRAAYSASATA